MLAVAFALLVTLALAALVVLYVAYPMRGQPIPHAKRLSDAMVRLVDRLRLPAEVDGRSGDPSEADEPSRR